MFESELVTKFKQPVLQLSDLNSIQILVKTQLIEIWWSSLVLSGSSKIQVIELDKFSLALFKRTKI